MLRTAIILSTQMTRLSNTTKDEELLHAIKKFGKYLEANPAQLQSVMFKAKGIP